MKKGGGGVGGENVLDEGMGKGREVGLNKTRSD